MKRLRDRASQLFQKPKSPARGDVNPEFPEGFTYLQLLGQLEHRTQRLTSKFIPRAGKMAPRTYAAIGTALSLMERAATCYWGCADGDHVIEFLVGRASNSGRAAVRLMEMGYYDEALGSVRTAGEIANLLWLFLNDPPAESQWKTASAGERRRTFGPAGVRSRLKGMGQIVPVDTELYGELSELVVHAQPETRPQAFNPVHRAVLAGHLQEAGVFIVLNELAKALPYVVVSCPKLVPMPDTMSPRFLDAALELVHSTGAFELKGWLDLRRTGRGGPGPPDSTE